MTIKDEEVLLLDTITKFCHQHLPPEEVQRRDENHTPPYDLVPKMAELGLTRIPFPEEVGGFALGWSTFARVQELIGYHAFSAASILDRIVTFGGMSILRFGTDQQKSTLLPAILNGEIIIALALTEPGAGSDARAVQTRAEKTSDGWKIHGRKTWISDAGEAKYLLTLCRTIQKGQSKPSYTAFLVPTSASGIHMTELPKVGNNCTPSWDIGFDEVLISDDSMLGVAGKGLKSVLASLTYSRAALSAAAVGCGQAAVDLAIKHAKERIQFGRPITEFQVIKHRLVDMQLEIRKAKLFVYELASQLDEGQSSGDLPAAAKIAATEALQFVTNHGMQILASAGYAMESPMQRYWRDARLYSFGEGTNEIQKEIIAKHMGLESQ